MNSLTDRVFNNTAPAAPGLDEEKPRGAVESSTAHSRDERAVQPTAEAVYEALWANDPLRYLEYGQITVALDGHMAILTGHVTAAQARRRAEEAAAQVPGVEAVKNELVDDEELVSLVCRALAQDTRTAHETVAVAARHGVVILSGTVTNAAARYAVEDRAASVQQVRAVSNYTEPRGAVFPGREDERALQPAIGQEVIATDVSLGHVEKVIINPHNRRVTGIVTRGEFPVPDSQRQGYEPESYDIRAYPGRERVFVIPVESVGDLTPAAVWLRIDASEAARYSSFDPECFRRPEASWRPPYPYQAEDVWLDVHSRSHHS